MPYQDTVFGGLMKAFPRWRFEKLVRRHRADYRVRRLPSWTQFSAMVFAQLSGSRSLREGGRCAGTLSEQPCPSGVGAGAALDACGCQPAASGGLVRRRTGGLGRAAGRVFGPARAGDAAPDRRDPVGGRQADRQLAGRWLRQAARGLCPRRRGACLLCRDLGTGQRHHPCQTLPRRARCHLRLRQGLLRLRLLGSARRQRVPSASVERRTGANPRWAWLLGKRSSAPTTLAQRARARQLGKHHRRELRPGRQAPDPIVRPVTTHQLLEPPARKRLHQTAENSILIGHGLGSTSSFDSTGAAKTQLNPSHAPCLPKLNRTAMDLFRASPSVGPIERCANAWMAGTSPAMTSRVHARGAHDAGNTVQAHGSFSNRRPVPAFDGRFQPIGSGASIPPGNAVTSSRKARRRVDRASPRSVCPRPRGGDARARHPARPRPDDWRGGKSRARSEAGLASYRG